MIEKLNVLVSVSFSGLPFHLKTIEIDQRGFSSLFFTISVFAKKIRFCTCIAHLVGDFVAQVKR